jgi:hypothetical protein
VDLRYLAGGLDLPLGTTLENFLLSGGELFLDDFLIGAKRKKHKSEVNNEGNNVQKIAEFLAQKKQEKLDKIFVDYPILGSFFNKFDLKESDFLFKKTANEAFLEDLELEQLLK